MAETGAVVTILIFMIIICAFIGFFYGLGHNFSLSKISSQSIIFNLALAITMSVLLRILMFVNGDKFDQGDVRGFFWSTILLAIASLFGMSLGILIKQFSKK